MRPGEEKTEAIVNYPPPNKNIKQVQSFLGLVSYFRKFIDDFSIKAKPLSDLSRKETKFVYGEAQQEAFEQLKSEVVIKKPVLKLYEQGVETEVHTDASKDGYSAVMLQRCKTDNEMHPVQFMSKKTNEVEAKTHSYELEVAAIIQALKKWKPYRLGQKFKVITDCIAFTMTIRKRDLPAKVARWALYM